MSHSLELCFSREETIHVRIFPLTNSASAYCQNQPLLTPPPPPRLPDLRITFQPENFLQAFSQFADRTICGEFVPFLTFHSYCAAQPHIPHFFKQKSGKTGGSLPSTPRNKEHLFSIHQILRRPQRSLICCSDGSV